MQRPNNFLYMPLVVFQGLPVHKYHCLLFFKSTYVSHCNQRSQAATDVRITSPWEMCGPWSWILGVGMLCWKCCRHPSHAVILSSTVAH
eukprot:318905-Amphidinium_carterae.1